MDFETITYGTGDRVATIAFNRPDQVHYNTARSHQGSAQRVLDGEHLAVADLDRGPIHRKPVLSGLINEYSRAA